MNKADALWNTRAAIGPKADDETERQRYDEPDALGDMREACGDE